MVSVRVLDRSEPLLPPGELKFGRFALAILSDYWNEH
jgi:hypothetical protein